MKFKILFLVLFLLLPSLTAKGATSENEFDISVNPEKVLFDLNNLKPGDSIERSITVINNGKKDFKYIVSSKLFDGSEKFYDKLDLTIFNQNKILYNGNLSDFNQLSSRLLYSHSKEDLVFKIRIPAELGNEVQGLISKVQFKFYVEGTLGGILPADGPKLPVTGTNMFNILVIGAVLVLTGSILQFLIVKKRRSIERRV